MRGSDCGNWTGFLNLEYFLRWQFSPLLSPSLWGQVIKSPKFAFVFGDRKMCVVLFTLRLQDPPMSSTVRGTLLY